jgi:amino acid adenylation domain-containing protein
MSLSELLTRLSTLNVKLWVEGDQLRYFAPKGVMTPGLLAELVAHKAALIVRLSEADGGARAIVPAIQPAARDSDLPLSFAQLRMWFLDQLEQGSAVYNIPIAMRLRGSLDVAALQRSLNAIVQRHEALRTTFETRAGQPVQIVQPQLVLPLPLLDLRAFPAPEREAEARRLTYAALQSSFDLMSGPLLHASLLQLDDQEHVLLLIVHHIVCDGASMRVLIQEFTAFYTAFVEDRPVALPELPIQYADYAAWQRRSLQDGLLEPQLAYWRDQLSGQLAILALPLDHPRPAIQVFRSAFQDVALPSALADALGQLSRQAGGTLFMTLLAAFQVLLARYSGQNDILVGTPTAGRTHTEVERLIGFFVNTLVLRTDLAGNPTFRELLGRVRAVCLGAYAHQDLPFEKVLEAVHPDRDLSRTPLFQAMFNLMDRSRPAARPTQLTMIPLELEEGDIDATAQCDLTLMLKDTEHELSGSLMYDTTLFDATTIKRMLHHFQNLLHSIVAGPDQHLDDLSLMTDAERRQLLADGTAARTAYPQQCIQTLFEAEIGQTPDAVAVVCGDAYLTRLELNRRANQLAHYLQALGVGPEVLVVLALERSAEMAVGLLGTLKAGGAYVPLDPAIPPERLAFILEETNAPLILTQQRLAAALPSQVRSICLDTDWALIAQQQTANPTSGATADNLAYVIYTSGSTGIPKGVTITHRSLVNYVIAARAMHELSRCDRVLQFAALNFDTSAEEIYPCLLGGATLVLRNDAMLSSASTFLDTCRAWALTILDLPTAYWHELTAAIAAQELPLPPALRQVIVGGDAALPERLATWQQRVGQVVRLVNTYGPTEATVVTTSAELTALGGSSQPLGWLPIGRPIPNTAVYVLDRSLRPTPLGVPGELFIGGVGLARGYLNRPAQTAEQFVPDPLSDLAGARLYRTGDIVRYLPDGNLVFLGRSDHQVKIRGFRIELGEIEAALRSHPAIRDAVAVVREDAPGDKRIIAYSVSGEQPPTTSELYRFVQTQLPAYMMPAAFVFLESLPRTASGKVDRPRLPAPEPGRRTTERAFEAPRTTAEEVLADIWAEVLGIEQISVYDNFFELGGHSLLATQVVARLNEALQIDLPLRRMFEKQTVAELAAVIEEILIAEIDILSDEEAMDLVQE